MGYPGNNLGTAGTTGTAGTAGTRWTPGFEVYAKSDRVLVPVAPRLAAAEAAAGTKPSAELKRLVEDFVWKWGERWYMGLAGFVYDGASIPRWTRWFMGGPWDKRWLGGLPHDLSWTGKLVEVTSERDVIRWVFDGVPVPLGSQVPIWLPPDLADEMFHDVCAAAGADRVRNWLALDAVNVYHETAGRKRYVTKREWNLLHGMKENTHMRCLNYEQQTFVRCEDECEGFMG